LHPTRLRSAETKLEHDLRDAGSRKKRARKVARVDLLSRRPDFGPKGSQILERRPFGDPQKPEEKTALRGFVWVAFAERCRRTAW
jgi:hypothetical protein